MPLFPFNYTLLHIEGFSPRRSLCPQWNRCEGLWSALCSPPTRRGHSASHGYTGFCKECKRTGLKCLVWGETCSCNIHLSSRRMKGRSLSFQPTRVLLHMDVLLLKLPISVHPLSASPADKPRSLLRSKCSRASTPWLVAGDSASAPCTWRSGRRSRRVLSSTPGTHSSPRSDAFLGLPFPQKKAQLQPWPPSLPAAFQGLNPLNRSPRGLER